MDRASLNYSGSVLPGITVVLCCHNSAPRLPETLRHLAAQVVPVGLEWEVIVIDNASTDTTRDVAISSWPETAGAPLRVVVEPRLGLSNARERGLRESGLDLVAFVDDDNWLAPDWVATAARTMATHPELGACGGRAEPVFEQPPPWWFEEVRAYYALGEQGPGVGDVTCSRGYLLGAGLTVRVDAWRQLVERGFRPVLSDRRGSSMTTGGDVELCSALRLAGWRLWYEPSLRLCHFIPASRLNWRYLRNVVRGLGQAEIRLIAYAPDNQPVLGSRLGLLQSWVWLSLAAARALLRHPLALVRAFRGLGEGDRDALLIEEQLGRLTELLRLRGELTSTILSVRYATWRAAIRPCR